MQRYCHIICFYKIAPMTIAFSAACIKIMLLNFAPHLSSLLLYGFHISRRNNNFCFFIVLLFIGLYKIKFRAYHFPIFVLIIINENFIKYSLSPVITA